MNSNNRLNLLLKSNNEKDLNKLIQWRDLIWYKKNFTWYPKINENLENIRGKIIIYNNQIIFELKDVIILEIAKIEFKQNLFFPEIIFYYNEINEIKEYENILVN